MSVTLGSPRVNVPVLSKTIVCNLLAFSMASAPLNNTPYSAALPVPAIIALGRRGSAPHIVCFTVLWADGQTLVTELDRAGFAVSSGSACTADTRRPSHVLAAMGAITHGNLRVSLPPDATEADVAGFLTALPAAVAAARAAADRASS